MKILKNEKQENREVFHRSKPKQIIKDKALS